MSDGNGEAPLMGDRSVLYLVNSYEPDAPTRLMVEVARAAAAEGWQCHFAAFSRGGELADDVRRHFGRAHNLCAQSNGNVVASFGLRQLLDEAKPAVAHVALTRPTLLGVPTINRHSDARVVITQHGTHEWSEGGPVAALVAPALFRRAASKADAVVAVSEAGAADLRAAGVKEQKLEVIRNGVDTSRFSSELRSQHREQIVRVLFPDVEPRQISLVGAAGNLRAIKRYDVFVEAAAQLHDQHPETRFVIWGEGPERTELETLISHYDLGEMFKLPGRPPDIAASIASLDVFVHPSRSESFGLAVAEAMASGVAVVASTAGALPELLQGGRAGMLVDLDHASRNGSTSPELAAALAFHVQKLVAYTGLRAELAREALNNVRHNYTVERMTREYLHLYDRLVSG